MSKQISGNFTATGAGTETLTTKEFGISVSGTFSGTVALQRSLDGTNWHTVESYTEATEKAGDNGNECLMRLNCTAYTSGTISYVLDANRNTTYQ